MKNTLVFRPDDNEALAPQKWPAACSTVVLRYRHLATTDDLTVLDDAYAPVAKFWNVMRGQNLEGVHFLERLAM